MHTIEYEFLLYKREWEPGQEPEVYDDFSEAFDAALESGCDSIVVVHVDIADGDTRTLFRAYEIVIDMLRPHGEYKDEINRHVFGSLLKEVNDV